MAKLYLKFDQAIIKEQELKDGTSITVGRLPDNNLQIDHLAVSGHHARIIWEGDHFALEDNNSLNGTFVNNRRISRCALRNGDIIQIGKHTVSYIDEGRSGETVRAEVIAPPAATPEATVILDSRKAKDMMAPQAVAPNVGGLATATAKDRTGQLNVLDGKTDHPHYTLSGKLTVIGKSDMASIRLKGWFAPKVAAVISKRDGKYLIAAQEPKIRVKVNDTEIAGHKELNEGDMIEVAKVKLSFTYTD
jgi:hypothetical protein